MRLDPEFEAAISPARYLFLFGALVTMLGCGLRIVGARGDLWLDEVHTLMLIQSIHRADEVFWHINHDNNHFPDHALSFRRRSPSFADRAAPRIDRARHAFHSGRRTGRIQARSPGQGYRRRRHGPVRRPLSRGTLRVRGAGLCRADAVHPAGDLGGGRRVEHMGGVRFCWA